MFRLSMDCDSGFFFESSKNYCFLKKNVSILLKEHFVFIRTDWDGESLSLLDFFKISKLLETRMIPDVYILRYTDRYRVVRQIEFLY